MISIRSFLKEALIRENTISNKIGYRSQKDSEAVCFGVLFYAALCAMIFAYNNKISPSQKIYNFIFISISNPLDKKE